jgi:hypothetical protein
VVNKPETDYDYPLIDIEYSLLSSQTPTSKKYDLSGTSFGFSAFQTKVNYGWYLDKKKEKTVLLTSLGYAFFRTHRNIENTNTDIPDYVKNIPNLHHLYLALIFSQKLKNNWEISGYSSMSAASDYSYKLTSIDYNINILSYIQKRINKFCIGGGYVAYMIGNNIKGIPIGYVAFADKRVGIEIMAPVSMECKYKFKDKNMFLLTSELDFDGYSVREKESSVDVQPDFADITDFSLGISYDRRFLGNLHWNIGVGYYSREISFLENNKEVDRLSFDGLLYIRGKVYCTF